MPAPCFFGSPDRRFPQKNAARNPELPAALSHGRNDPAIKSEENAMRLITNTELSSRSDSELAVMFHMVSGALAMAKPGTPERRKVVAGLQNISMERAQRYKQCIEPGL